MFELTVDSSSKPTMYADLVSAAQGLTQGESDAIANMANVAALIWQGLPDLNWAGFYRYDGAELVLGPFQGKPACIRIPMGQGVCGTAAAQRATQCVRDVHAFPGHIACDAASQSEIVVPVIHDGRLVGVLDLDSPIPARFDEEDVLGLETLVAKVAPRLIS
jgi:L-methionine (R)-S-oxide reductase